VIDYLGRGLGFVLYLLAAERRRVASLNISLCFPSLSTIEQQKIVSAHFKCFGRAFLERGILWWSSKRRIEKLVRVEGVHHWLAVKDKPVIWLAPHFVGLDMGGVRLSTEHCVLSMYSHQKNHVFDKVLYEGRMRFNKPVLFSRQDGVRPVVKALRQGFPFYYLPDMDFGSRDSIFVPFFGVQAATITGLSRLARLTGAVIVPCVTRQLSDAQGYELRFYPAWENFPGPDIESDTRRMNAFIEERVLEMPEQYFWLHKRFKTRPEGEKKFY
jgi:KDO2-lipid IV(A) lauroyltransferase